MKGVVFCGASGTGKSTLATVTAGRYGFRPLPSITAAVYRDAGVTYAEAMGDPVKLAIIQREIHRRTAERLLLEAYAAPKSPVRGFVSERGIDVLAYTALMVRGSILNEDAALPDGIASVLRRADVVTVFVRPCPQVLAEARRDDGERRNVFLTDEWVYRVDGAIRMILEATSVPYLEIDTPSLQERLKLIDERCALAGFSPTA